MHYLSKIDTSINKLESFIAEVIDYSRTNRKEIRTEKIHLETVAKELIEDFKYLENFKRIEFKYDFVVEHVVTDKFLLKVILSNLISNAIEYQKVNPEHMPFISLSSSKEGGLTKIIIEDNGEGIAPQFQERIFEMFYRGSNNSTGSGLGLYILKEAIEKLNGKIEMNSELEGILYAIEKQSEHPLADAVVNHLKVNGAGGTPMESFESITGRGVQARRNGISYFVGNKKLIEENNVTVSENIALKAKQLQSEAKTVVYFFDSNKVLAVLAIADKIKATSAAAIKTLQEKGIEVHMLTGDNEQTAKAVSQQVGLSHFKAEVLPSDKAEFVKQLQAEGKVVAMVGDGINDSHALAQADVSIAMGKGSDIAMDVAKMTLITSDLQSIPKALNLSSKTVIGIKQNLFWAFIYNVIGIPIAAGILYPINGFLLDPMIAGAAMAMSSVSVVGNSLRLKFAKI